MIIDCISDLHGHKPKLRGGDLLIVAGDITTAGTVGEYDDFADWLEVQDYSKKIVVPGNHDNNLDREVIDCLRNCNYLCDAGFRHDGFYIYGTPWTRACSGMDPRCMAYTYDLEHEIRDCFDKIPRGTDILISHGAPHGIFDCVESHRFDGSVFHAGSIHLRNVAFGLPALKLHVFGHIHEWGGKVIDTGSCKFVNASVVDNRYKMVNQPVRIKL